SAAAEGPATSIVPAPRRRAIRTSPSGVRLPVRSTSSCGTPLARSSSSVVATSAPASSRTGGFSMRKSITSWASPSRPIDVAPTVRPAAPHSASSAASATVLPVFFARPTSATRGAPAVSSASVTGGSARGRHAVAGFPRGELPDDERREVVRVGPLREPRVVAELLGELVGDTGASARQDQAPPPALGLDHLDELGQVLDVEVLLRDSLRDEDRVCVDLDRLAQQHAVGNLAAEVVGLEGVVALEAVVAVVALQVEHRVDPDAVRVRAGRGADDDDLAAHRLLGEALDLVLGHVLDVEPLALQRREVDGGDAAPVHDEVRVALGQLLVVDDLGLLEAHPSRQFQRRLAR